jgi:death-on-curing protein
MDFLTLTPDMVEALQDAALNPGDLPGRAGGKSLDGALARVDNRIAYGLIGDVFDLAAAYCVAVAQGHCFNDANKRTAFRVMQVVLDLHGFAEPPLPPSSLGDVIILVAQGKMEEAALADWLRERA